MLDLLDQLVEDAWAQNLLAEADAAYARLREDADAWREELAEREEWDQTLSDGLDQD